MARKSTTQEKPKTELSRAERFTNAVIKSYSDVAKGIEVTQKQMQLISNYFIKIDEMIIRNPDTKIQSWEQVRLNELSRTLAHMAKLNLDMALDHFSFMPFEYKGTSTYNLSPVISKSGYWYIAKTYGIDPPENYVVELVYSNDKFTVAKKDANHECDSYTFEVTNPFDRGEVVGGFGYLEYKDKSKNKIITMSEAEILKYKPKWAKDIFWTGENGKKMYEKTIAKQLLKSIPKDPDKVNGVEDSFKRLESEEINYTAYEAKAEIEENMCSGDVIDVEFEDVENHVEDVENKDLFGNEIKDEEQ